MSGGDSAAVRISDLATPSLILDRRKLQQNLKRMADAAARYRVPLRPPVPG